MHHLWHKVKQQVVSDTEDDAVDRLVHIDGAELTVILGDLCRVWRGNLILTVLHCTRNGKARMLTGKVYQLVFADILAYTFRNGLRPSVEVEEHL